MKTTLLRTILAAGLVALGALPATAATDLNEATVLQLTGTAQVVRAPGQAPVALRVGDKIPQGATVITGAASTLHIQPFAGAVSTVNANTEVTVEKLTIDTNASGRVTKQTALLNLKSGNVVSMIDPSKKDINDYGVSTPKGVAAARGTHFTSAVNGSEVTVSANADNVVFTTSAGAVTVRNGQAMFVPAGSPAGFVPTPVSLSTLANSNTPEAVAAKAAVAAGVTALTQVLQNNANTGVSAADTTNLAAQVIAVSNVADPTGAATKTAAVVSAISNNSAVSSGGKAGSAAAVASVMQYATDAVRVGSANANNAGTGAGTLDNANVVTDVSNFAAAVTSNVANNAPAGSSLNASEIVNATVQGAVKAAPAAAGNITGAIVTANSTNTSVIAATLQGAVTAAPDQQSSITTKAAAAAPDQAGTIAKAVLSVVAPGASVNDATNAVNKVLADTVGGSNKPAATVQAEANNAPPVSTPPPPAPVIDGGPTTGGNTIPGNNGFPVQPAPQENTTISP